MIANMIINTLYIRIKKKFLRVNWIKTIWFNFKALPAKQAFHLPFHIAYNVSIIRVGKIELQCKPSFGLIKIGTIRLNTDARKEPIVISNKGTIVFTGVAKIHMGAKINVRSGFLTFGDYASIGSCTKIVCMKNINIGNNVRISWNCQVFDTDFHFLHNIEKDTYYQRIKPITIEDSVFVGNGTTIGKGTYLTKGSVVSCCSKVSSDFRSEGPNLLIMGMPAIAVKHGVEMSSGWHPERENEISKMLKEYE